MLRSIATRSAGQAALSTSAGCHLGCCCLPRWASIVVSTRHLPHLLLGLRQIPLDAVTVRVLKREGALCVRDAADHMLLLFPDRAPHRHIICHPGLGTCIRYGISLAEGIFRGVPHTIFESRCSFWQHLLPGLLPEA